jgi:hypothetical protein
VRGVASNYMCDLKVGDKVQVIGPFGTSFLMPNHPRSHIVMICTGTGSAPMRAMTEWRRRLRKQRQVRGRQADAVLRRPHPARAAVLRPAANLPKDFIDINFAFSARRASPSAMCRTLMRERAADLAPLLQDANTFFYVCGLKSMEEGVVLALRDVAQRCHVKASVGDVLGTVTVRSYLERKEATWWQEVRLTAGALSLKIVVHTILLFLLMRVRMAPLLALGSTLSGLARGIMDLGPRAAVNSADEFGELARDLNHFLDRIGVVVQDLDHILSEVVTVGERLGALNRGLEQQVEGMRAASMRRLGEGAQRGLETRLAAARAAGGFDALDQSLGAALAAMAAMDDAGGRTSSVGAAGLRDQLARLRNRFDAVNAALHDAAPPVLVAESQAAEYQAFSQSLREMALLEATMQKVAESGQQVLKRLARDAPG